MNRPGRAAAVLVAVLGLLFAWTAPAGADDTPATADHVLVVGVPGLAWRDIDPTGTPELWGLAENSAIGALSVRAARSTTCLLDGWATLGAGNRADRGDSQRPDWSSSTGRRGNGYSNRYRRHADCGNK